MTKATEGNTTAETNADPVALARIVADLQARLEKYESANVIAAPFQGEAPRYRLNNSVFLEDDTMHVEGEELEYWGVPNGEMVPLNEPARQKMRAYIEELTEAGRAAAEKNGRNFSGLVTDQGTIIAMHMQDARRAAKEAVVAMPEDKGTVPVMPHTDEAKSIQRRRGRPPKSQLVSGVKQPQKSGKITPETIAMARQKQAGAV